MKCSRRDCEREAEKRHSASMMYCRRCYRIMKMLDASRRRYPGVVTTWKEIAKLWDETEARGTCPHCLNPMPLYSEDGKRKGMATIQHYDNGTLGIICLTCNLAHSKSELRDKLFSLRLDQKYCHDCKQIKSRDDFHNQSRFCGRMTYCKQCQNARNKRIKERNRRVGPRPYTRIQVN